MNPERSDFLNLLSLPGRANAREAAWKFGFERDDITVPVSTGLLKPLGHLPPGAMKFFLTADIEQKKNDAKWITKVSETIRLKCKEKNERAAKNRVRHGGVPAGNGHVPGASQP
jgi:hypothetical protein